ncbi:MAG: ABC transporter ATP-binding protein [Anaerolineae bacterium]|nr:ABC transporter ATP-binding protein [Anaerolineae bacterium]
MSAPILQVKDLRVYYHTEAGAVKAVDGVSFDLESGIRMGLVGESGCGKSTMAMALMRLIKEPGRIEGGEVLLDGVDLTKLSEEEMRQRRLSEISLIPQGAMNSLNPVMRVKDQIIDGMKDHGVELSEQEMMARVYEVLDSVDLEHEVAEMFPHELSGGMKQRVCVAIAISLHPKVVIADEPTSALDVVVQRQVMETIQHLQENLGISMILIGHDMGLMAQSVERLAVMYAGKLAEIGEVEDVFSKPLHPYTELLISTLPVLGRKGVFTGIPGITPSLLEPPSGCLFHPRCPKAFDRCSQEIPELREVEPGRFVACHLYD